MHFSVKFFLVFIVFHFGAQAGNSQSVDTVQAEPNFLPRQLHAEVALSSDTVIVPLEEHNGHPFIRATINGRGPFRLGVETGAPILILKSAVFREVVGDDVSVGSGQGYLIDSVRIGTAQFLNVATQPSDGSMAELDGLLGLNAYYDALITFDYAKRSILFTKDTLPLEDLKGVFPLKTLGGQVYGVEIIASGKKSIAVLDTQNESGFTAPPSVVSDTQFVKAPLGTGEIASLHETHVSSQGRLKEAIQVGEVVFQKPIVHITPISYDFLQHWNVGWPTLRNFAFSLDQRSQRIRLIATSRIIDPPPPDSGFLYVAVDSNATVTRVLPERLATQQGLKVGDVIISVDGIAYVPKSRILSKKREGKAPIHLVVRRGNLTKSIVLTRQEIMQ